MQRGNDPCRKAVKAQHPDHAGSTDQPRTKSGPLPFLTQLGLRELYLLVDNVTISRVRSLTSCADDFLDTSDRRHLHNDPASSSSARPVVASLVPTLTSRSLSSTSPTPFTLLDRSVLALGRRR
jgi:hypothetical protein